MQREHMVHSSLLTSEPHIVVIGAGGNGSAMLASLATLNHAMQELGHPGFRVTAVDGDTVSPSNVGRQGFYPCDVGQFKTDVLIQRINMGFGTRWSSMPTMFTGNDSGELDADMVISCVDSRRARSVIAKSFLQGYYVDLGNNAATGQVVIGEFGARRGNDFRLPHAVDLFPEIADTSLPEDDQPSCSMAEALERQNLFINRMIAGWAAELLWQMFRNGKLNFHGNFVNLVSGRVAPIPVDEEVWSRMGYKA
ncbi:PRTRC system ThiF family protein [Burkholderia cenocepacia]|uniref:PRTRC system ThiF family protein n=1 Tax=Burkholderia cenocepacia TaxID=95486 RepID=UPI003848E0DD